MKKKKTGEVRYAKYGYIFSLPFVIAFLIFQLYPVLYTAFIGFTNLKGVVTPEVHILDNPFENFQQVLTSGSFKTALGNTFFIWICNFIPQLGLALLLTAWFTDRRWKIKGQGIYKVLIYMPNIITAATIAILFKAFFDYPTSPVNDILVSVGILEKANNFLINKGVARGIVAFIQFWMWYGYTMLILISGVLGINPEIFDAAEVDGASRSQVFFQITLPNIKTIMLFTLVTSLIGGLNMFDIPKLFLLGGPDNATLTTSVYIYNQAFSGSYLYNRAAAASMIMFVIIMFFSSILFFLLREKDADGYGDAGKKIKKQQKAAKKAARKGGVA
ncbi:MAG: sugar ABC transporter permease [Eubacterium sp.]|nr:sugar ABC transporter permease [Eubacterium sp.]